MGIILSDASRNFLLRCLAFVFSVLNFSTIYLSLFHTVLAFDYLI
jgi:hypothetical protein